MMLKGITQTLTWLWAALNAQVTQFGNTAVSDPRLRVNPPSEIIPDSFNIDTTEGLTPEEKNTMWQNLQSPMKTYFDDTRTLEEMLDYNEENEMRFMKEFIMAPQAASVEANYRYQQATKRQKYAVTHLLEPWYEAIQQLQAFSSRLEENDPELNEQDQLLLTMSASMEVYTTSLAITEALTKVGSTIDVAISVNQWAMTQSSFGMLIMSLIHGVPADLQKDEAFMSAYNESKQMEEKYVDEDLQDMGLQMRLKYLQTVMGLRAQTIADEINGVKPEDYDEF